MSTVSGAHEQDQLELFKAAEVRSRRGIDFASNPTAADMVRKKQLDWHSRNSACLFARKLYKNPSDFNFKIFVVDNGSVRFLSEQATQFCKMVIDDAFRSDDIEAISLIFPHVKDLDSLKNFIEIFCYELNFKVEVRKNIELCRGYGLIDGIGMRLSIPNSDVYTWPMALGDFIFFPNTRRAPYFEFLVRTRRRSENVKEELKAARPWEAHLADIPFETTSQRQFSKMWKGSKDKKSEVLNGQEDRRAKAAITLVIPSAISMEYLSNV